jgi:hypothetical protein
VALRLTSSQHGQELAYIPASPSTGPLRLLTDQRTDLVAHRTCAINRLRALLYSTFRP